MGKLSLIKNIFLLLFLIVGVYFIANFGGAIQGQIFSMFNLPGGDVQGVSTKKAEEISIQIGSNVGDHVEDAKNQALNVRLGDAIATLSRLQKIPQDIGSMGAYIKEQVDNMLQSREQKRPSEEKK